MKFKSFKIVEIYNESKTQFHNYSKRQNKNRNRNVCLRCYCKSSVGDKIIIQLHYIFISQFMYKKHIISLSWYIMSYRMTPVYIWAIIVTIYYNMEYNMSINFKFIGFQLDPRLSKIIMIMIFIGRGRYIIICTRTCTHTDIIPQVIIY